MCPGRGRERAVSPAGPGTRPGFSPLLAFAIGLLAAGYGEVLSYLGLGGLSVGLSLCAFGVILIGMVVIWRGA